MRQLAFAATACGLDSSSSVQVLDMFITDLTNHQVVRFLNYYKRLVGQEHLLAVHDPLENWMYTKQFASEQLLAEAQRWCVPGC